MTGKAENYSSDFITFSKDYGKIFSCDDTVYEKYLKPSVSFALKNWNNYIGKENSLGLKFDFELGIVENKSLPNAICGFNGHKHIILMYHTFPIFLLEFFYRLLCNERVLKHKGNTLDYDKKFHSHLKSPPGFSILSGEVQIKHIDDISNKLAPLCAIRKEIADKLYHYAMVLIWEHEFAHAINGHVHFVQNNLSSNSLNEKYLNSSNLLNVNRAISYIEMSADKGASFNLVVGDLYKKSKTAFEIISNSEEFIFDYSLKILAGSFLSLFWMLSDVVDSNGDFKSIDYWTDHPSSLARAINFTLSPITQCESLPLDEELKYIVKKATEFCYVELINLGNDWGICRPFNWLNRKDMFSKVFHEKHRLSNIETEELISKLKKYRYI
ncbi:hypothetical protein [Roseivirga pacifica]|uniref:hypothetical protein n=1 Tax=Roseivirga pacifica TaxID=1267423 RepID=UPI003BAF208C